MNTKFLDNLYKTLSLLDEAELENLEGKRIKLSTLSFEISKKTNSTSGYIESGAEVDYDFKKIENINFAYYRNNSSIQNAKIAIKTAKYGVYSDLSSFSDCTNDESSEYEECKTISTSILFIKSLDAPIQYKISTKNNEFKSNHFYLKAWNKENKMIFNKVIE